MRAANPEPQPFGPKPLPRGRSESKRANTPKNVPRHAPHNTKAPRPRETPSSAHPAGTHEEQQEQLAINSSQQVRYSFQLLLDLCAQYLPEDDLDLIRRAFAFAAEAHAGVERVAGGPYIEHPLAVARTLAALALDACGVAAALLHDTVEDKEGLEIGDVRARFGAEVAQVVDGVTKLNKQEVDEVLARTGGSLLTPAERKLRQQDEAIRKLVRATDADPRVLLVKLADRLDNLRTIGVMRPDQRERSARETLEIYAPLAERIGLYLVKSELEDLAFQALSPNQYLRAATAIHEEEARRARWAHRMRDRMESELAASGVPAAVNWRTKRPYRAYIEATETGMEVAQLHDVIAFRVIVNTAEDCYQAMRVIHSLWHPYDERIHDYIHNRKKNGYQSLHTAVFALDGRLAQIHIRTHEMHRQVQHGVCDYWLADAAQQHYQPREDTTHPEAAPDAPTALSAWQRTKPEWMEQIRDLDDAATTSARRFMEIFREEVLQDQVVVSTPKGERIELPAGATVLDFAYRIHTEIGDHTAGAIIQRYIDDMLTARHVRPDHTLVTGDVVKVLRDAHILPEPEWLDYVRTQHARNKIARALRREERDEEHEQHQWLEPSAETEGEIAGPLRHPNGRRAEVRLAFCCSPVPGDKIVGLADRAQRVTIHRPRCRRLRAATARRRTRGVPYAEPIRTTWEEIQPIPYRISLEIYGQDHLGLMQEVSGLLAQLGISIIKGSANANRARYKAAITMTLGVPAHIRCEYLLRRLHSVPGVVQVVRATSREYDETPPEVQPEIQPEV